MIARSSLVRHILDRSRRGLLVESWLRSFCVGNGNWLGLIKTVQRKTPLIRGQGCDVIFGLLVERYTLIQTSINIAAPTRFAPLAFDLIDFLLVWYIFIAGYSIHYRIYVKLAGSFFKLFPFSDIRTEQVKLHFPIMIPVA